MKICLICNLKIAKKVLNYSIIIIVCTYIFDNILRFLNNYFTNYDKITKFDMIKNRYVTNVSKLFNLKK